MPEPAFTESTQLGIVVRDLEVAMRRYDDDGIGPIQAGYGKYVRDGL